MIVQPMPYPADTFGSPDANTLFLARFRQSPPVNEVGNVAGTLVGGAACDTANAQLVLDGVGDWATWAGGATFDVTANWTAEYLTDQASSEVGGAFARSASGTSRYAFYAPGDGHIRFFADAFDVAVPLLAAGIVLNGSEHHIAVCRDGGTWRMYVDGVQVATNAWAGAPANSGDTFFVGTDALLSSSRDIAARLGRVKLSNVARYPAGTPFTPPTRLVA